MTHLRIAVTVDKQAFAKGNVVFHVFQYAIFLIYFRPCSRRASANCHPGKVFISDENKTLCPAKKRSTRDREEATATTDL